MAEEERMREHSEESVKLFVGQVPKQMTEEQLLDMFKEFAIIDEVNIIKDKATRASRGCCFVICPSREEADKAITACHNKPTLPGASSPFQVKYADGELERLEHKLFVGMLPKNVSDPEVSSLFSQYGTITDLQILRGSQQTSRGYAFLKYEKKEQAIAAVEALNGKHTMEVPEVLISSSSFLINPSQLFSLFGLAFSFSTSSWPFFTALSSFSSSRWPSFAAPSSELVQLSVVLVFVVLFLLESIPYKLQQQHFKHQLQLQHITAPAVPILFLSICTRLCLVKGMPLVVLP